jgi:hypothetical protein
MLTESKNLILESSPAHIAQKQNFTQYANYQNYTNKIGRYIATYFNFQYYLNVNKPLFNKTIQFYF